MHAKDKKKKGGGGVVWPFLIRRYHPAIAPRPARTISERARHTAAYMGFMCFSRAERCLQIRASQAL